jgi:hypothetical protein
MSQVKNKKLWEECKAEAMVGKSRWDARVSQHAVRLYKKKGGKYNGPKPKAANNTMVRWTKEEWMYGGRDRNKTGRYLPKAVWALLTPEQKRITNRNKRKGTGKNVPWEPFVLDAFKKLGISHKGKK